MSNLTSAAPDMFELLKRLEYWLAEIRAVIAKAKGEKI